MKQKIKSMIGLLAWTGLAVIPDAANAQQSQQQQQCQQKSFGAMGEVIARSVVEGHGRGVRAFEACLKDYPIESFRCMDGNSFRCGSPCENQLAKEDLTLFAGCVNRMTGEGRYTEAAIRPVALAMVRSGTEFFSDEMLAHSLWAGMNFHVLEQKPRHVRQSVVLAAGQRMERPNYDLAVWRMPCQQQQQQQRQRQHGPQEPQRPQRQQQSQQPPQSCLQGPYHEGPYRRAGVQFPDFNLQKGESLVLGNEVLVCAPK